MTGSTKIKTETTTFQTKRRRSEIPLYAESMTVPTNVRIVQKIGTTKIVAPLPMTLPLLPTLL
jgi:hypothetical protein